MRPAAETLSDVAKIVAESGPRIEAEAYRMALAPWALEDLIMRGLYSPHRPEAYLDHLKRTSPKPRLRTR